MHFSNSLLLSESPCLFSCLFFRASVLISCLVDSPSSISSIGQRLNCPSFTGNWSIRGAISLFNAINQYVLHQYSLLPSLQSISEYRSVFQDFRSSFPSRLALLVSVLPSVGNGSREVNSCLMSSSRYTYGFLSL